MIKSLNKILILNYILIYKININNQNNNNTQINNNKLKKLYTDKIVDTKFSSRNIAILQASLLDFTVKSMIDQNEYLNLREQIKSLIILSYR